MHTYVDGLDRFLGDHHNEVVIGLALVVLAEAVIIWLWARRAAILRQRLAAAEEAAGSAATHAAAALAVDALRPSERELEAASVAAEPVFIAAAPVEAPAPQQERYSPPATVPAPQRPRYSPPQPAAFLAPGANAAPDLYATPAASAVTPVETAAALRAAAESQVEPAPTGVAAWTLEAAARLPAVTIEERLAGLGGVAAWTETEPLAATTAAWTWSSTAAAPAAGAAVSVPGTDTAINLLLVEDDVNVAKLYRMLLESRGYTVTHAADGVEGLDAARRERPDLILLDVMMPRMNGISFLQALREDAILGDVPAVVLSNFREPRLVERAMALGALEYMVKAQTRPETLVGAIPHWLKGERVVTA